MVYRNVWDIVQGVLRGNVLALNTYIRKRKNENKLYKLPFNKHISKLNSKNLKIIYIRTKSK